MVCEITETSKKAEYARRILELLPEWFEIPETREQYIRDCGTRPFFAAFTDGEPSGFLSLKETGRETVEIAVMGVLKAYHRRGIGQALVARSKAYAADHGYEFMQVKTVQPGVYEEYDQTNRFYRAVGFKELEVLPEIWGPENPCQIYIMKL
ncbi:MAG: GNAT family N-acetyltransferase [Clostridia bacterium]|nr:GNAT family N-acetyltransferase [Clostridia bacterium]